jgi:DNA-directed RNA polymerase specialized sigma24 family protein
MLGKLDPVLENPRSYQIRTATHLWIDRTRRRERERAAVLLNEVLDPPESGGRLEVLADDPGVPRRVREAYAHGR